MNRGSMQGLACALTALVATVAMGRQSSDAPEPELYFVIKEHVKPSMIQVYEEETKFLVGELKANKIDPEKVRFMTVAGPEMGHVFVLPLKDFAGMDQARKDWEAAIETIGRDTWTEHAARADAAVASRESFHVVRRMDLSYAPKNPRLEQDEVQFINYTFFYVIPGKEQELEAVAREYAALYSAKDIDSGWSFYQSITGSDLPLYVVARVGKSRADYFSHVEKEAEIVGEEAVALWQKVMACVRRVEMKYAVPRPDLSYPE